MLKKRISPVETTLRVLNNPTQSYMMFFVTGLAMAAMQQGFFPMSVSLEKQIKDRHGYVAVFLYMICQGGFILLGLSLRRCR